ncbi:ABC-three component system middle component 6 [Archangium sp.]|uniref:ABC-three component system middle component 6 n=1 Tax=Archangium sp. TaxID=1872627 RepID=UPI002D70C2A0|nr:ABC-three component system middle component 6 [Archangium sp.]HYO59962.1 ABC-three component system middle component 6 [Archangium sp.]
MILPTKHISTRRSLLGVGAAVLKRLREPQTVSRLWEHVRDEPEVRNFERFVLALDLLYALGAVEFKDGLLRRASR